MQPTLESKFTLFQRHPTLTPMCLKNPTKLNFLLEQSFKHIAFFSRNLPTPPGLPESMNDDSPSQSILLDDALESLCESFSRECYSWSKGLRPILTVISFVIISKDLRGFNLLVTYPAYHREKDVPESNQSYTVDGKSDTFSEEQEPNLPRKKQRGTLSKRAKLSSRDFPGSICHNGRNRRSNHR